MNKELVDRYLDGAASEDEARRVLEWLSTNEGQKYFEQRFNKDFEQIKELEDQFAASQGAHRTFAAIESRMFYRSRESSIPSVKLYRRPAFWYAAACIALMAVVLSTVEFFYTLEESYTEEVASVLTFSTGAGEQKLMTLSDGTTIRLNEYSNFQIPQYFDSNERKVRLEGEAFFEVTGEPDRPFIVETDEAEIRVLGTSFSVKTSSRRTGDLYVTVSEGKVSLAAINDRGAEPEILEKNTIGIYNSGASEIKKESMDISNYLSWIHGRIVFEKTPFEAVVRQLEYIYDIDCEIQDQELYDASLTADFSEISLENVLQVISHSLQIEFEQDGNTVYWRFDGSRQE